MKSKRHEEILELISRDIILTQEELQAALIQRGFKVTQSTVSRDIKELRLVKGHDENGVYRYIIAAKSAPDTPPITHYHDIISRSTVSVDFAMNNVVIKCYSGMASSVCVAVDALYGKRMLGSLAGEDTIIIVTAGVEESSLLAGEIKNLL